MKKHIRKISLLLCLALLSVLFSACSGNTGSSSGSTSSETSSAGGTASEESSGSENEKPFAGQNLVLFSFAGWLDESLQDTVSAKLEEDTGMTVEYIIVPWTERFSKMTVMVASGEQVDVTGK